MRLFDDSRSVLSATVTLLLMLSQTACSHSSGSSDWKIDKNVDAMTDVAVTSASTQLVGNVIDLDVVVACGATGKLAYQFRAFNKQKEAEDFQTGMFGGSLAKGLQVRLDGRKPQNKVAFAHDFSNQFLLQGENAVDVGQARQVVIAAGFQHGSETYTLDQSSSTFRDVVQPCMKQAVSTGSDSTSVASGSSTDATAPSNDLSANGTEDIFLSNKSDAELGIVPYDAESSNANAGT